MKHYTIDFTFENKNYTADVTEIGGLDDTQYEIHPRDEKLAERFSSNIIRNIKEDPDFQYVLPKARGSDLYMKSLVKGLKAFIDKK